MTNDRYNEILNSSEFQKELKPKLDRLHDQLVSGRASVLVGAGFSKNAEKKDGVEIKDWAGLARVFYKEIHGHEANSAEPSLRDPVRLASIITFKHGHPYIDSILERELPDEKITPGNLHKELVRLSWADIYTTNYDTLLERAATPNAYQIVKGEDYILHKDAPRIIKLHGSFPDVKPYVIDEDDYENYIDNHPKLTTAIRNTLIQKELYLIGFSGNDPNFKKLLQWLKKVCKDEELPLIYLIETIAGPLPEDESLYKQSYNIETILRPTVFNDIEEYFSFIFQYLHNKKSGENSDWRISVSYEQLRKVRNFKFSGKGFSNDINESELTNLIETYRNIRETYPGWAFLRLSQFENGFEHLIDYEITEVEQLINRIPDESLLDLVYEFEWRLRKAFYPISLLPWLVSKCEKIINDLEETDFNDNAKLQSIAIALLSHYRITFDVEAFDSISRKLISAILSSDSNEIINRFRYEMALQAISLMDYDKAFDILNQWTLNDDNYEGVLWKSAILIEINREEEAYALLEQAIKRLNNLKKSDIQQSYLGTFLSVINIFSPYKGKFETNVKVEPSFETHSYFRYFKVHLYDALQKKQDRIESRSHRFNLQDVNITRLMDGIINSTQVRYATRIQMIWEQFGYPFRLGAMTINSQLMLLSCDALLQSNIPQMALNALMRAAQTDTLRTVIRKESVVKLDKDIIYKWTDLVLDKADSVTDWSASTAIVYRLSIIILIVISRMSVILDVARIKRIIPFLLKIYSSQNHEYKNEYLITVFNCLPESEYGYIVQLAAECPIKIDEAKRDIWFPQGANPKDISLSDKAVLLVVTGLNESDTRKSNSAYVRATNIYNYCNEAQKATLDRAVVKWRSANLSKVVNATYSFNFVKSQVDDSASIHERLENAINKLRKQLETPKVDDGVIGYSGRPEDEVATVHALRSLISKEQGKELYPVLAQYMLEVVSSFERENTRLSPVFGPSKLHDMDAIAEIIAKCDSSMVSRDIMDSLYDSFTQLYHLGYPRYDAIEALNNQSPILDEANLFNDILSIKEDVREEALEYLSSKGFLRYPVLWDTIWNKVAFSSTPEIIDYIKTIIRAGKYSDFVLPNSNTLVVLFRNKISEIDAGFICEGDKYDIIYRIKQLAGYISNIENLPQVVSQAISAWRPDSEMDKSLPKDVILGFEEGVALYQRHHQNLKRLNM